MNFLTDPRRLALLPWVLIFFIYLPSLRGPYILDDSHTVQGNAAIQNPANIFKLWTSAKYYSSSPDNWGYRPLTTSMNAICWWIGAGATWPYHLLKMLLFAGVCVLLGDIWRRLMPKAEPAVVGWALVLFAVNPVHTQVVSYISATSTLLAGFFAAAALLGYLKWRESGSERQLASAHLSLLLSMLSKEEGIVMIALIPMTEIYLRLRDKKKLGLPFWPIAGFFVAAGIAIALVVWKFEPSSNLARGQLARELYFMTQWRAYLRYLAMFWVPVNMNADNLEFGFSYAIDAKVILAGVINLALIGFALASLKKRPLFALAIGWFYIAVSPSSSIVVLAEPVNDHRAFIAYFGLLGLNVVILERLSRHSQKVMVAIALVVVAIYSVGTVRRNFDWASNERLWLDTVAKNPSSPRALNNLAVDYMGQGRMTEALELLDRCKIVGSLYGMCYINRAVTLASLGRDEEASADFATSVQYDLSQVSSRRHWAQFLKARGMYSQALQLLKDADLAAQGQNFSIRWELIQTYAQSGDIPSSQRVWRESLPIFGENPSLISLGESLGFTR